MRITDPIDILKGYQIMNPTNREIQLRKTCQLYAYVLASLGKEVPQEIEECADSHEYDCLIDCVAQLSQLLASMESETLEKIVNNSQAPLARDLAQWWEMYQLYIPLNQD